MLNPGRFVVQFIALQRCPGSCGGREHKSCIAACGMLEMCDSVTWHGQSQAAGQCAVVRRQRCLLQVSAEALDQSGGAVRSTGTYIGCMFVDYMSLQREAYAMSSTGAVSSRLHVICWGSEVLHYHLVDRRSVVQTHLLSYVISH